MTNKQIDNPDPGQLEHLRDLFREGHTIAEIVYYIRSCIIPESGFTLIVLRCFMKAYKLTLREARSLEGAPCMGNEAISDEELDMLLRPLITQRLRAF